MTVPGAADVQLARERIRARVRRTPLVGSKWLSDLSGADVALKLETLQVTHSFKARGAANAVAALRAAAGQREPVRVVTASAGNHGVALAWAAGAIGAQVTIFTPAAAPATKLDAIPRHGAVLRAEARDYDEAEQMALAYAASEGAVYVSPYNHPDVIAGAGTIALEVLEDAGNVDDVIVPVGGGGLISGIALALKHARPGVRVVGVEAEHNRVFARSLERGCITPVDVQPTIADGLSGNLEPGSITFDVVRDRVDSMVSVTEAELRQAMRDLVAREHLIAEGAGVPAVAALLAGKVAVQGRHVVAILSGSNVDVGTLRQVLGEHCTDD